MKKKIEELVEKAFVNLGLESPDFVVEHPTDLKMGDYTTNATLIAGRTTAARVARLLPRSSRTG